MKKHLQNLLLASAVIGGSLTAIAQPTLTGANTNPVIGEMFVIKNSNVAVAPGAAGANQTWNVTGLAASSTATTTFMSVASTPSGSAFPAANIAGYDGTNYAYSNNSTASSLNQGAVGSGVVFSYSNPETILTFPVNFNNTGNDTWSCVFTTSSITFTRSGTTTVTADGYGTITTPANTYNNAMRIHFVQSYSDVSSTFTLTYNNDEYIWYVPGTHYAVATTFSLTSSSGNFLGGSYLSSVIAGLNSYSPLAGSLELFPNPASSELNLSFSALESGKAELKISNVAGKQLQNISDVNINTGDNNLKINTNDLAPGIYFMGIYMEGILQKNERFVITR